jgi:hypothetical protein
MVALAVAKSAYSSTNSGITWTSNNLPIASWISVASSIDGDKVVAAGSALSGGQRFIYTSTNSGQTWVSNNVPSTIWNSVASSADGNKLIAIAGSLLQSIYTSTNGGTTWVSNSAPTKSWRAAATSADGNKSFSAVGNFPGGSIYSFSIISKPQLKIGLSNTNALLSWLVPSTNFVLQQNLDLTTTNWVMLTNTPTLNLTNLNNEFTLSPSNSSGFFRLKAQ